MFEQSMLPKGKPKTWAWVFALLGQLLAVGVIILIPLMYVDALPTPDLMSMLVAPPPPPPPPPPPAASVAPRHVTPVRHFDVNALVEPKSIPKQIPIIQDLPDTSAASADSAGVVGGVPGGVPGGVVGGASGGVLGSILNTQPVPAPPPPPPPKAVAPAPTPSVVHVGGNVEAAKLISGPKPAYPAIAREARVQGVVELKAVIGKDGKVADLKVADGNPLLVNAALDAVRKWVYKPTYLNGKPVDVATEIVVTFQLG